MNPKSGGGKLVVSNNTIRENSYYKPLFYCPTVPVSRQEICFIYIIVFCQEYHDFIQFEGKQVTSKYCSAGRTAVTYGLLYKVIKEPVPYICNARRYKWSTSVAIKPPDKKINKTFYNRKRHF